MTLLKLTYRKGDVESYERIWKLIVSIISIIVILLKCY